MIWILVLLLVLLASYYYLLKPLNYWKNLGVAQGNPVPLFGDVWKMFLKLQPLTSLIDDLYNIGGPDKRYAGMYQITTPALIIKDPELIKQITVKDFDHFLNHKNFIPDEVDEMWSKNLLILKDDAWKSTRITLSPAFTSSKMKNMFSFMTECAENFIEYFLQKNDNIVTVELKDIFAKYTNDVIASLAFGFKCDSLKDPNNEFYVMGKQLKFEGFWNNFKIFLLNFIPSVCQMLEITFFPVVVSNFFKNTIKEAIQLREKGEIVRQDMLQLLIDSRKNALKLEDNVSLDTGFATAKETYDDKLKKTPHIKLSDDDITAQSMVFFFAGFESSSNLMCLLGYELGANPKVQEKLQKEIDDTLKSCNGKITYEALLKMKYIDMVVSESLRKWPNIPATDRKVTKPYTIEPVSPGEKPVHLKVDDVVLIPTYGFHHDPRYYPNPEVFDPERFSEENKGKINPYTYLPFGAGPRNCIGSRFALLECKIIYFHILSKFNIVRVEKTKIPFVLNNTAFNISAKDGFWFGLKRRETVN